MQRDEDWRGLFNSPAFHALNRGTRVAVEVRREDRLIGGLAGILVDGEFINGFSAPFGGIDVVDPTTRIDHVVELVSTAVSELRREVGEMTPLTLRLPPASYSAAEGAIQYALSNLGFVSTRCELNQSIDLSHLSEAGDYRASLKVPARKALRHLEAAGLVVRLATDAEAIQAAYAALAANRAAKGRRLSLPVEYVVRAMEALRPAVRMVSVDQGATPIAAALVYQTRPDRELVVAWGDAGHDLRWSPTLLLAEHLVEDAVQRGIGAIDLGISTEPDDLTLNTGLAQFKRTVGAVAEPRWTLRWEPS